LNKDFQLVQTDRYGTGTEVRQALEDENYSKFKTLVPEQVQSNYTLLLNDIKKSKISE
jgi:predicted nucleotidyltransferase